MEKPSTNEEKSDNKKWLAKIQEKYKITKKEDLDKYVIISEKLLIYKDISEEEENWLAKIITEKEDSERMDKFIEGTRKVIKQIEENNKRIKDMGLITVDKNYEGKF